MFSSNAEETFLQLIKGHNSVMPNVLFTCKAYLNFPHPVQRSLETLKKPDQG
jgi:hypothetical protein